MPDIQVMFEHRFGETPRFSQWLDSGILLAVSGGADSVAMFRCFMSAMATKQMASQTSFDHSQVHIAHVNHQLRGADSEYDAAFVKRLASQFHVPYHLSCLIPEQFASDETGSFEAAARNLRYDFLRTTAERNGLRYVAVAHNADDQIETVLHRIIRGTSITGLSGIPKHRQLSEAVTLVRPMLASTRKEIINYLAEIGQPYCTDKTNAESHYTRNKIRNRLLPQLVDEYNPAVGNALLRLGEQAAEWGDDLKQRTNQLIDERVQIITQRNQSDHCHQQNEIVIVQKSLQNQPRFLVREVFVEIWRRQNWSQREMGFGQWEQLAALIFSSDAKKNATKKHGIAKVELPGFITAVADQQTVQLIRTK